MSALLTKAFEKWFAECTTSNLPARPDAIIFALMGRDPTREDDSVPEEKITYTVSSITTGKLDPNNVVYSAVVPADCEFSYDWICLIHRASGTLCGVIKTPIRQKFAGESLVRNFTITCNGIAQAAQITVPPQSWQVDVFPDLKAMLKTANHLSEIATGGEEAQRESRDHLGLKAAATMDVQSDIRDRTEGRLAIPGAHGFGRIFPASERLEFLRPADFLQWVKTATPGRYIASSPGGVIIPDIAFNGIVEIIWPTYQFNNPLPADQMQKIIIFYGNEGHVYYNRYNGNGSHLIGWEPLKVKIADFCAALYSSVWRTTIPAPGGLVLAAYVGSEGTGAGIALSRSQWYPGSALRQVVFEAEPGNQGSASAIKVVIDKAPISGSYIALTGVSPEIICSGAVISLFIRYA